MKLTKKKFKKAGSGSTASEKPEPKQKTVVSGPSIPEIYDRLLPDIKEIAISAARSVLREHMAQLKNSERMATVMVEMEHCQLNLPVKAADYKAHKAVLEDGWHVYQVVWDREVSWKHMRTGFYLQRPKGLGSKGIPNVDGSYGEYVESVESVEPVGESGGEKDITSEVEVVVTKKSSKKKKSFKIGGKKGGHNTQS